MYSELDYINLRKKQVKKWGLSSSFIASLVGFNGQKYCVKKTPELWLESYLEKKKGSKRKRDEEFLAEYRSNEQKVAEFIEETFFVKERKEQTVRYTGSIVKRKGWMPDDLTVIPFEVDSLEEIILLLQNAHTEEAILVTVDIWNQDVIKRLREV